MALNYRVAFIDSSFYKIDYQTKFSAEWDELPAEDQERFINLASTRVKRISDRPFIDLGDLEFEQAEGVQVATARLVDYWMEYGFDLNRISGSITLGSYSASQTVASDPDYIPENVYEVLQDVQMYTPAGYIRAEDLYRADDQEAITYGVRFKTLERIKDVALDKTIEEAANKNLLIPTVGKVLEDIRDAKLSPFVIIGTITEQTGSTKLPTSAELNSLYLANKMILDNGTAIVPVYGNPADVERVPVKGEAIRVKLQNGTQEVADFDGTEWHIDGSKNVSSSAVTANTAAIADLNGLDDTKRAIKASEGDTRYIKTDGSNEMKAGYVPADATSIATKEYVDSLSAGHSSNTGSNSADIAALKGRVDVIEPQVAANRDQIALNKLTGQSNTTNIGVLSTKINTNSADVEDYINNKANFALVSDQTQTAQITPIAAQWTVNGDSLELDVSGLNFDDFKDTDKVELKITNTGETVFLEDSFNDISGTGNEVRVAGNDQNALLTTNKTLWTITGINASTRNWFTQATNIYIEQAGKSQSGGTTDTTARAAAATATSTANAASAKADTADSTATAAQTAAGQAIVLANTASAKATTNTTNITANTASIAGKQDASIPTSNTFDKTVVGAINEVDSRAKNNESDIAELNKGNFDVNGDGTKITKIFNANGDIFTNNSQNLLLNDIASTTIANIGYGYKGEQSYGENAEDIVSLGTGAKNLITVGFQSVGNVSIGQSSNGSQLYGASAKGAQSYGGLAEGDQSYGSKAIGDITIGSDAHTDGDGKGTLVHGAKKASFEQIIDKALEPAGGGNPSIPAGTYVLNQGGSDSENIIGGAYTTFYASQGLYMDSTKGNHIMMVQGNKMYYKDGGSASDQDVANPMNEILVNNDLAVVMDVTFDDGTTTSYKVGK